VELSYQFEETMKMYGTSMETPTTTLQLFEPDSRAVYTLEQVSSLTRLPRRLIAVYFKHGLVSPVMDPACGGWYFNDEAIRILRRIDYLRTDCGLNLVGVKLMMDLAREVERLQEELNFVRRQRSW
jgi:DNA-binding transcriptional MerR regulator